MEHKRKGCERGREISRWASPRRTSTPQSIRCTITTGSLSLSLPSSFKFSIVSFSIRYYYIIIIVIVVVVVISSFAFTRDASAGDRRAGPTGIQWNFSARLTPCRYPLPSLPWLKTFTFSPVFGPHLCMRMRRIRVRVRFRFTGRARSTRARIVFGGQGENITID